jgi:putative ABC transport system permease protein
LVFVAIGSAFGLLIAQFGSRLLVAATSQRFLGSGTVAVDLRVIGFATLVSLITGIAFALLPAIRASAGAGREYRLSAMTVRTRPQGTSPHRRLSTVLAATQVALTLILLVGAGLFVKSFWQLNQLHPGYNPRHAVSMRFDLPGATYQDGAAVAQVIDTLAERIGAMPGVEVAGFTSNLPLHLTGMRYWAFTLEKPPVKPAGPPESLAPGLPPPPPPPPAPGGAPADLARFFQSFTAQVSPGFFRAMEIPVLRGRDFRAGDSRDSLPVAIVNQAFADRYWTGLDPLGQRFKMRPPDPWITVVGIVGNIRRFARDDSFRAEFYRPFAQTDASRPDIRPGGIFRTTVTTVMAVLRTERTTDDIAQRVRTILASIDPTLPIGEIGTLQGTIDDTVGPQRLLLRLFILFGISALLLAAVGVYGVTTYATNRRWHEMAVRVALGAAPRSIEGLVMTDGAIIACTGVLAGVGLALALSGYLRDYLFQVSPFDGWAYAGVALALALVVLLSCYLPARRAGRVDPLTALKGE